MGMGNRKGSFGSSSTVKNRYIEIYHQTDEIFQEQSAIRQLLTEEGISEYDILAAENDLNEDGILFSSKVYDNSDKIEKKRKEVYEEYKRYVVLDTYKPSPPPSSPSPPPSSPPSSSPSPFPPPDFLNSDEMNCARFAAHTGWDVDMDSDVRERIRFELAIIIRFRYTGAREVASEYGIPEDDVWEIIFLHRQYADFGSVIV